MESTLCIPRMDLTTPKNYIQQTLYKLNWGKILYINEIPLRNDPTQKRVLIRIKWTEHNQYKDQIDKGDSIKLVHSDKSPWFWKIVLGKTCTT